MLQILVLMNRTILLVELYGINCKLFSFFLSSLTHIFLCLVYFFLTLSFSSSFTLTLSLSHSHHVADLTTSPHYPNLSLAFFFFFFFVWVNGWIQQWWVSGMILGWVALILGGFRCVWGGFQWWVASCCLWEQNILGIVDVDALRSKFFTSNFENHVNQSI